MLSACMIIQDEEECIARALDSIEPYVDEIIIVDGGSIDATMDIARSYAKVKLFEIPFPDDFGLQRSRAIERASGDWILITDADEYWDGRVLKALPLLIEDVDYDAYQFRRMTFINGDLDNPFDGDETIRLFRSYCRYEGKLHETLVGYERPKDVNLYLIHDKRAEWQQKDNEKFYDMGQTPPEGWEKIDGRWVWLPSRNGYTLPSRVVWPTQDIRSRLPEDPFELLEEWNETAMVEMYSELDVSELGRSPAQALLVEAISTLSSPQSLLDVGCGNGVFALSAIRDAIVEKVVGIDISKSMIALCRAAQRKAGIGGTFEVVSVEAYQSEKQFSVIIADDVLEQIYALRSAVEKIRDLLDDDGLFCGAVPFLRTCDRPSHLHYFTEKSLRKLLLSDFFGDVETQMLNYVDDENPERHLVFLCKEPIR